MRKVFKKNLPVFQFHLLQKFSDEVEHAVLSRLGGSSKPPFDSLNVGFSVGDEADLVQKNRDLVCFSLGLEPQQLFSANQTHSKNVMVIDEETVRFHDAGKEYDNIDGFVTALNGVGLLAKAADCQALVMFDPVRKVIAAVHSGWKGLVQDVSGEAIRIMKMDFGVKPENILVGIAPSLGPCCAFFSDPETELPVLFKPFIKDNKCVDLWGFSIQRLQDNGIEPGHIELARVCTYCGGGEKFFSYRRDRGITGRFGALIYLRDSSIPLKSSSAS